MVESRDKDIVGISKAFASGGRVAMAGPRMDFAADRLKSSGFETVRCAPGDGAGLAVIDPGRTFGGTISPRRLLRLLAGHPLAAIFVSEGGRRILRPAHGQARLLRHADDWLPLKVAGIRAARVLKR